MGREDGDHARAAAALGVSDAALRVATGSRAFRRESS